ncbi:ATP-dependent (S)-NAD(P)H-hydrate dehydratase-like isoform X2 [Galleria mellonella]|uniref:ATP-dependent (S)-NAD(P)H-hydrate dehydratase n=1 Tax=Galleria mellonella TaxID=7137 RepID=A0A6J3C0G0_GALME|nr:ATP-dependent (S)-NAD(P)H-hydrate dehydratase-like isoform X2 [Galleria mellonella]
MFFFLLFLYKNNFTMNRWCLAILFINIVIQGCLSQNGKECTDINNLDNQRLMSLMKAIVPELEGKRKGDAGKIGVIGGATEYTGAPYFSAITALKVGADLVYVITTESAAPVIKAYSPDLIVYPYLNTNTVSKIYSLLNKMDVIIIGPGLGREEETLKLIYEIFIECKKLRKPLVIDADGLYAVSKNLSVLQNYPSPGIIFTPNYREANKLKQAISLNDSNWFNYWGDYVTVLVKGSEDHYYSSISSYSWSSKYGGSGRRVGGQGDILSGALGTLYNWALNLKVCDTGNIFQLAQSISTFAAARFTRECNYKAYLEYSRSLTTTDMLKYIHASFESLFNKEN